MSFPLARATCHWILPLAICSLPASTAFALDPDKRISQFTHEVWRGQAEAGLSFIQAIVQTPDGYLWLGTQHGLIRFDGVTFRVFRRGNTPGVLNDNVQSLVAARDGSVWLGTEGGLVHLRDGRARTFSVADGLPHAIIRALHEDDDGNLWIGTHGGGVARLRDGRFDVYDTRRGLSSNIVRAVLRDREGALWVGTDAAGLNRVKDGHVTRYGAKDGLLSDSVWALHEDDNGRLLVGTFGAGLAEFRAGRFVHVPLALSNRFVRRILADRAGSLWIGTEGGGLHRYYAGTLATFGHREGLSNDSVRAILEDREGSLWIGTNGGGLNRLKEGKFTTYTTREGLRTDMARVVFEDRQNRVWIGTDGGGLHRFGDGRIEYLSTREGLSGNDVRAILEDRSGSLWVGTQSMGLNRMTGGRITRIPLPDSTVKALLEDRTGAIWIGTYGGGLSRFADGRVSTLTSRDGLGSDFVTALAEGQTGDLWIGTNGGGLSRLRGGRFTTYTTREGLSDDLIRTLYADRQGVLWIGTAAGGLCRTKGDGFACYTSRDGLPDDAIYQVLEDERQRLWMSSRRGIFNVGRMDLEAFDRDRRSRIPVVAYDTSDGMRSLECTGGAQPAGWRSRSGQLWFTTTQGVVVIDPRNIRRNLVPPPVILEDVLVGHQPIEWRAAALAIGPGAESLEFRYTAPSLLAPEKVQFKYRLEPFEREWVPAGTRRSAHYTSLPPGTYRFMVVASNNDGVWSPGGASLDVRITPYFHQTWVFLLLCTASIGAAAWGWHRHRVAQVRERLCAVLAERNRMARELHDTLEQGMMAVSFQVQAAHLTLADPEAAREHLLTARSMLNESLAEARRSVKGLRSISLERAGLAEALSHMLTRLTAGTSVKTHIQVDGSAGALPGEMEGDLLRIGQEAVTNALKHAAATRIDLALIRRDSHVQLRVRDDGQGFDAHCAESPPEGHFGLVGMKERVRHLGGQLSVRTEPGAGTEVVVDVPLS